MNSNELLRNSQKQFGRAKIKLPDEALLNRMNSFSLAFFISPVYFPSFHFNWKHRDRATELNLSGSETGSVLLE